MQRSLLSFFHGGSESSSPTQKDEHHEEGLDVYPKKSSFNRNNINVENLTSKMLRPSQESLLRRKVEDSIGHFSATPLRRDASTTPSYRSTQHVLHEKMEYFNSSPSESIPLLSESALCRVKGTCEVDQGENSSLTANKERRYAEFTACRTDVASRICSSRPVHSVDSSIRGIKRVREDQSGHLQEDFCPLKRKLLMEALGEGVEQKGLWEEAKAKFEWLSPSKVKDSKGRKIGDKFFDKRSLQIPAHVLNQMAASQKQYWSVKSQYMDTVLFFKVGKFYELYELDAEIGHRELNWKMTVSGVGRCRQVGVPESGIEEAVEKLLARGYKVGRMEQVETAEQAKARRGPGATVQRKLIQVLTPSTAMDENMKPEAVHLLAIKEELQLESNHSSEARVVFGFAFVDAAAGQFYVGSLGDDSARSALGALLTQVAPRELLYELGGLSNETMKALRRYSTEGIRPHELTALQPHNDFMEAAAVISMIDSQGYFAKTLKDSNKDQPNATRWLEVLSSVNDCKPATTALGALAQHLVRLKLGSLLENGYLAAYEVYKGSLRLDGQTLSNLEIFNNNADGGESGTLFAFVNNCSTPFGKRLLRRWMCHPLQRINDINERLDALEDFRNDSDLVSMLRSGLKKLPDLERLVSQIRRFSSSSFEATIPLLSNRDRRQKARAFGAVVNGLLHGIDLLQSIRSYIAEGKLCSSLLLALSNIEGLTEAHGVLESIGRLMDEKFPNLKEQSQKQSFNIDDKDSELLQNVLSEFSLHQECWRQVSTCLAQVDVLLSFTVSVDAANGPTCRPIFTSSCDGLSKGGILKIEQLWHPFALKAESSGVFVRNNVELGSHSNSYRAMLLTGPNMGGKSTLLRATCIVVILAQMGCYVPAESCMLSPVDTIFTRLGASDRIMSGESTFMVECNEASSVLRYATPDSLVILDELGRGTSTFDGYAIAYSVLRHLADSVDCRLLFATHYHPLTQEFAAHPRVILRHMACAFEDMNHKDLMKDRSTKEINAGKWNLTFLYKLTPGASPDSYGLHVASLAGLPCSVIARAEKARKIIHARVSSTFQRNEHRMHFSHVHEQWFRTILDMSGLNGSGCNFSDNEDAHDSLICVWHELQSSLRESR
ncbi:hypothetical protein KP509_32G069600 [Ceratopteris richardii]|uniref:DNA mismatch repair proteins mutS family domain-containing protein n=1 Tax=Ceratopteris richardii TaxID=49495 RepID=A0A8T2QVP4_CERRI|nr:hypothetical protein KP509_32G069600 [Ceratopteris richardii]